MGAPKGKAPWNAGTGKGWTDRRGYRWIRVNGRSVREHRHVMEQHLGRKLLPTEIVHHRNGDTADNRLDNLEVMQGGDHMRHHHKGERRPDMAKERIARAARDRETIRRLSATNKELLEALGSLSATVDAAIMAGDWKVDGMCDPDIDIFRARVAIAKATGGQP